MSAAVSAVVSSGDQPTTARRLAWQPPIRCLDGAEITFSDCRHYSIHRVRGRRADGADLFTAFRRTDSWNNVIGWVLSRERAIELCEEHASTTAPDRLEARILSTEGLPRFEGRA